MIWSGGDPRGAGYFWMKMMLVLIMCTLPWSNSCGMFYRDNVQSLTLSLMKTSIRLLPLSNVLPEMVPAV